MMNLSERKISRNIILAFRVGGSTHSHCPTSKQLKTLLACLLGAVERMTDPLEYTFELHMSETHSQAMDPSAPRPYLLSTPSMPTMFPSYSLNQIIVLIKQRLHF